MKLKKYISIEIFNSYTVFTMDYHNKLELQLHYNIFYLRLSMQVTVKAIKIFYSFYQTVYGWMQSKKCSKNES